MEDDDKVIELQTPKNSVLTHDQTSSLTLNAVNPVNVHVRDLSLKIDTSPPLWETPPSQLWSRLQGRTAATHKAVLNGVTASMPRGSLTAIIGSSGSGKTSLLNLMAGRMSLTKASVSGCTTFNGVEGIQFIRSAYVMQEDVLIPSLTVRETLQYAADLRLPPPTTPHERRAVVDQVILELGLKECADTRIGTNTHKGCSGGEKRRTSIGMQMLANPSVLFCDEPTTGLDATSAFQIVRTLKRLAQDGRTVIISVHTPRSEIWGLLDNLVLLARGSVLYAGSASQARSHFERCGHVSPPFVNPAEFLIDLAAIDTRSDALEAASQARVGALISAWEGRSPAEEPEPTGSKPAADLLPARTVSFRRQFGVLTSRTFKTTIRDPMGVASSLFEAILMAVVNGWVFLQLDESQAGIRSRQGSLYTASSLNGYLILLYETYRLTIDVRVFDRERTDGVVGVPAFLLSRRAARFFIEDLPVPIIFATIFYFMVGYRQSAEQFFVFLALTILTHYLAVTFAAVAIGVARNFPGASLVANLSFTLQSFACGYFVQANQIPVYMRWLKWVAYTFYIFGALCANEFLGPNGSDGGHFYACPFSDDPDDPACTQYTGRYIMQNMGLPSDWIWRPIVVIVAFILAHYLGAALLLQYNRVSVDVAQARTSEKDLSAGKETVAVRQTEARTVTISLDQYAMDIRKRRLVKPARTLSILQPVTAEFQPGQLNVIMGPSGSGKTSLLNSLARRLRGSLGTQYKLSGSMRYNGAEPSESVVRSVTSFVPQDDDALMSSLTVRETLRFAAGLRLPKWMSQETKNQRAEEIMLRMGLKDCADTLVGGELVKGISGGEKRRVSIAIQILTDPRILFLDEPTSGLDAFTASSIIQVLGALAAEGRTLVLTIHQSRSDLFQHFSSVLLLARGGHPVYAGRGDAMLEYFGGLGHSCPETTNPADFVLDLITIDLQHTAREAESRKRVQALISAWGCQPAGIQQNAAQLASPAEMGALKRQMQPFHITYPLVLRRSALNFWRQPQLIMARTSQVAGIAVLLALFFAPLGNDYAAVQSRMGYIQEVAALYFVGLLQNIATYPPERDIFNHDSQDSCYSTLTFLLAYTTLELPFEILSSLFFGALAAYASNLRRTVPSFLLASYSALAIINCGESLGIIFCTLFSHAGFAVTVTSLFLSIATVLGGVMSIDVPAFLAGVNYISPVKYAVRSLVVYSMTGMEFFCTEGQKLGDGTCPVQWGEDVMELYGFQGRVWVDVLALGGVVVGYRLFAGGVVWGRARLGLI